MVDDLGWQDVACYYRDQHGEEPFYETPHLDRIAERGIRFTQAYSPAMTCAPSRAAFLTGQWTPHNGVYHVNMGCQVPRLRRESNSMLDPYYVGRLMPGKPAIGMAMKQAGYTTAHVGKWHVAGASGYPAPIQVGFDFSFDHKKQYNDPAIYNENDPKQANFSGLFEQPKNRLLDAFNDPRFPLLEDDRPYDSMTDLSQRWIQKVALGDEPFFLNLCPNLVHGPVMTRDRKRLAHYCQKLGIPFPTDQGAISDPDKPGQHNPYYASMVDSVDWIIGQIVHTLETTDDPRWHGHKLIDNTYVFISSDNGGAQKLRNWKNASGKTEFEKVTDNAPLREGKASSYEGGCRIPFLVMGPGINAASVNTRTPINLIDLFPTFLAIAGADRGELALDGCNLMPVITGQHDTPRFADGKPRDTLYFHYPVLNAAFSTIRRGPWKLMKNTGGSLNTAPEVQLFRLYDEGGTQQDLSETKNVASDYPEIAAQLLADLNRWLEDYNGSVPYKNAADPSGNLPGQQNVPKVKRRESKGTTLSVEVESGKSKIANAFLLYTINPGRTEEWFQATAQIQSDRIEAKAPPGMTHGVFCLLDENHFLITSEPIPSMEKLRLGQPVSEVLTDGFAFRPGLEAMIELTREAIAEAQVQELPTQSLQQAMRSAQQTIKQPIDAVSYSRQIRELRKAIRSLNIPAAKHTALNWFPQE
ncbi:sulfatase-like hydrolase/transferase [Planctomycetaceae bacterium SH139]